MDNQSPVEKFYFDLEERTRLEKERQAHYNTLSPEEKRAYQKAKRKRGNHWSYCRKICSSLWNC